MNQKEFLDKEIPLLIKKGYSKSQAAAIAYSTYSREYEKPKAQQGVDLNKPTQQGLDMYNAYQNTQQEGYTIDPNAEINTGYIADQETLNRAEQNRYYNSQMGYNPNTGQYTDNYDENGNGMRSNDPNYQDYNNTNIYNPYGGVGLEQSIFTFGQGLGEKDPYKIGIGAGASLLKIGRTGMAGFATGKEDRRIQDEMDKKLFEDRRRPQYNLEGGEVFEQYMVEGGKIKNADLLTGQYVTDQPNSNINAEHGEFLKNNETGEIQKIIGEKHKDGGVDLAVKDGQILSDYTKIGAKNAKELKEKYQLSLRATDTFAKAMDKINDKIGVTKATEELAKYIERLGENEAVKDDATKRLNEVALTKTIEKHQEKLDTLKGAQDFAFEDIFKLQEQIPKKSDGKTLLDKKGNPIEKKAEDTYQEGGLPLYAAQTPEEERRSQAPQMPIKRILYNVGTNEIKEGSLQPGNYTKVEYDNGRHDYLTPDGYENFKRMSNYRVYMEQQASKNKQIIPTQPLASLEEGGHIYELAKKHNISPERAMELSKYQEGGNANQEDQMQQVMSMIAQQLQSGVAPEEVAQKLISSGVPEEQVQQLIQAVAQQLQGQSPQEEQMEGSTSNQQEEGQEEQIAQEGRKMYAEEGGEYTPEQKRARFNDFYAQAKKLGYTGDANPKAKDLGIEAGKLQRWMNENRPQDVIDYFETSSQPLTAKHVDLLKKNASWAFKQAGISPSKASAAYTADEKANLKAAYAKGDGKSSVAKEDYNKFLLAGFNDNKWDWRYPVVPLDAENPQDVKNNTGVALEAIPKVAQDTTKTEVTPQGEVNLSTNTQPIARTLNKWIAPNLPVDFVLPPSAMQMVAKEYIPLDRLQPIKQTVEPYLAEAERQGLTAREQLSATGLPPQVQEALAGQQLAATQIANNDAIGKVEDFNADNQFKTDQFNIGQAGKEDILNAQFNQSYMDKMFQTVANQEREIRGYYNQLNLNNRRDFRDISDLNMTNALSDNFKSDGSTVTFKDTKPYNLGQSTVPANWKDLTSQEQYDWTIKKVERRKQAEAMKTYQTSQNS